MARHLSAAQRWFVEDWQGWHPRGYEWFFRFTPQRAVRAEETRAVLRFVETGLRPGDRILEVGSGTGHYTVILARRCAGVTAVDASPRMRRYLSDRLRREGVPHTAVRAGRVPERLTVTGPFDGMVSVGTLNYVEDFDAAVAAMSRPLSGRGWMVFTVPPDTPTGRRYALRERLVRKRVYVRSDDEVRSALAKAGYRLHDAVTAAGVTRVMYALPAQRSDAGAVAAQ